MSSGEMVESDTYGVFERSVANGVVAKYTKSFLDDFAFVLQRTDIEFDAQEIIERIWLGSATAAVNTRLLTEKNIKYALTVTGDIVTFEAYEDTTLSEGGDNSETWFWEHAVLNVYDTEEDVILQDLEKALGFIDECLADPRGGSILVHCIAGISRSASVVIAYLMTRRGTSFNEALTIVSDIREQACPNDGFMDQLIELEKNNNNILKALDSYRKLCDAE